jgi:tetratricopeptide (TPR) repeat protein
MKRLPHIIFIAFLFSACNNAGKEQPVTQLPEPEQEKEMKDAIAKYPDSIPLRKLLIKYYEDKQDAEHAMKEIDNTIKIDSNDDGLWDRKAAIYLYNDDSANAIKAYNKAVEIFPDPQYIMSVGMLYAFRKNDTALAMADGLLIGKNANAEKEAFLIKGVYYSAINKKQKALTFFDSSLNVNYTYMPAYLQKGITLFEMGKYEETIKVFTKATTLDNSFSEGYYWMGRSYEKMKDNNNAIENYRLAIQYDPDYVEAKDALGKFGVK